MNTQNEILKETIELWQSRVNKEITEEDAREISETLYEFIKLLLSWYEEDQWRERALSVKDGKEVA